MLREVSETPLGDQTRECWQGFNRLCQILERDGSPFKDRLSFSDMRDEFGRFKVWSGNIGALQGGTASLDHRLRESSKVREQVLKLLVDLQYSLDEALAIVSGDRPDRTTAESEEDWKSDTLSDDLSFELISSDEDSMPQSELALLSEAIKETTTCLFLVSISIRKAAPMDRYARSNVLPPLDDRYDIDYVWQKFPHARKSHWLVERLGKAITRRRQFFKYRRHHHSRLSHVEGGTEQGTGALVDRTPVRQAGREGIEESAPPVDSEVRTSQAPTLATPYLPRSTAVDTTSELDRSESSYVSSVSSEAEVLSIPPPPPGSGDGNPFECPYCFEILQLKDQNTWRHHIFQDLEPFVCTFPDCQLKVFSSMNQWFSHEMQMHRTAWTCYVEDCQRSFSTRDAISAHIEQAHAGTFTHAQLPVLLELCNRPVDRIPAKDCPLCSTWEVRLRRQLLFSSPEAYQGPPMVTPKRFKHHLGRHLVQIALYALPVLVEDSEDDNMSDQNRSQRSRFGDTGSTSGETSESEDEGGPPRSGPKQRKPRRRERKVVNEHRQESPLYTAAKQGQQQLESALQAGEPDSLDINDTSATGETALHQAARDGNQPALAALHACGADLNANDTSGSTALHRTADADALSTAQWFLEHGADSNTIDANGATPLGRAARKGHLDMMSLLLDNGAVVGAKDLRGFTALHRAAERRFAAAASLLLSRGAAVDTRTEDGLTALHLAVGKDGFEATARALLDAGAAVGTRDRRGHTPLQTAVAKGHGAAARFLLDVGADVDANGPRGIRAVHRAVYKRRKEMLGILLEHGADVDIKDEDGWSALYGAARLANEDMARMIIEKGGGDLEARDNVGMTPLHAAAYEGHVAMVRFLAEKGADLTSVDSTGRSALHSAAFNGHLEVVEWLVEHGAAVTEADKGGMTAMHLAAMQGHLVVVEKLLDAGADAAALDGNGNTPMDLASISGKEVMRILLARRQG